MKSLRRVATRSASAELARASSFSALPLSNGDAGRNRFLGVHRVDSRERAASDDRDDIFLEGTADPDLLTRWDSGSPSAAWYETHFNRRRRPGVRRGCTLSLAPVDILILLLSLCLLILVQDKDTHPRCTNLLTDLSFFRKELFRCRRQVQQAKRRLSSRALGPLLGKCSASATQIVEYLNYTRGDFCPESVANQSSSLVEDLLFDRDCLSLPRRACIPNQPIAAAEPLPLPQSLWHQPDATNVDWQQYNTGNCRSFDCLRDIVAQRRRAVAGSGDAANGCVRGQGFSSLNEHSFNFERLAAAQVTAESRESDGPTVASVLASVEPGAVRIGLDMLGGTGDFAAQMADKGIVIVTTGQNQGLPVLQAIALRGLPSLHLPFGAHLPFFDGALDLVRCQNWPTKVALDPSSFEPILFEWDRVLRPGGIMWLDRLPAQHELLQLVLELVGVLQYVRVLASKNLKRLSAREAEDCGVRTYLIMQKPLSRTHH